MTLNGKNYILIKIEGFKTYNETSIIGPFNGLLGIIGKNGSGKTNIIESLEFLFSPKVRESSVNSPKKLFTKSFYQNEKSYIKVGFTIKRKDSLHNFIKIVDYSNITEYFLNNKKISSKNFLYEASKLKLDNLRKMLSTFKNKSYDSFFDPVFVYDLIQDFSNSRRVLSGLIKSRLLAQKLQENYIFYSKKMKFILNEKKLLLKDSKKLEILKLKKTLILKKNNVRDFFKINWFLNKIWKVFETTRQKFKIIKELLLIQRNFEILIQFEKNVSKLKKNKLENLIGKYLQNFAHLSYWFLKVNNLQISDILNDKIFSFCKKINSKKFERELRDTPYRKLNRKKLFKNHYKNIVNQFTKNEVTVKISRKKKKNYWENRTFFFYTQLSKFLVFINKRARILKKKKINIWTFYLTHSLIFLIANQRKPETSKNKIRKDGEINVQDNKFDRNKIRGNILNIFKPLDSKYNCFVENLFDFNKIFILVDSIITVETYLKICKKPKNVVIFFYPLKTEPNLKRIEKPMLKKKDHNSFNFDYDEYDCFIPNLILKLYLRETSFSKLNKSESFNIKLADNFLNKSNLENRNRKIFQTNFKKKKNSFNLKAKLKTSFIKVLTKINEIDVQIRFDNIEIKFLRLAKNFIKEEYENCEFFEFKSVYKKFSNKKQNFLTEKVVIMLNSSEFLKFKKSCSNKIKYKYKKKKDNGFKIVKLFKTLEQLSFLAKKNIPFSRVIPFEIFYEKFFLLKKNLELRLKNCFILLELTSLVFLIWENSQNKGLCLKKITKRSFIDGKIFFSCNKKINETKIKIQFKKYLLLKAENIISGIFGKNPKVSFIFLGRPLENFMSMSSKNSESVFLCIGPFLSILNLIVIKTDKSKKEIYLKKFKIKILNIFPKNPHIMDDQFNFLQQKFLHFKKKMINNRKNYFVISQRNLNMKNLSNKKFSNYFENWSKLARVIYKNLTATHLNPLGGTIFFDYIPVQPKKKGQILFSIIPLSKNIKNFESLSKGESTLATLAIFVAFNYVNSPPLVVLDEFDSHLDSLNLEKFFWIFKKLEKKRSWNIIIISQKKTFSLYFSELLGIYRYEDGSRVHLIKY